jgi:hypothetical protein
MNHPHDTVRHAPPAGAARLDDAPGRRRNPPQAATPAVERADAA